MVGRNRHFLVDSMGLLLGILVHSADITDGEGGEWVMIDFARRYPRLEKLFADGAYQGEFVEWVKRRFDVDVQIVSKEPGQKGFIVLPKRWVVERSIAWACRNRRLSKDYERLPESTEAFIYLAFIRLMLHRLAPDTSRRKPYQSSQDLPLAA